LKVAHILGELRYSGAERMLECSIGEWTRAGIVPTVIGTGDGSHPFADNLRAAGYDVLVVPDIRSVAGAISLARVLRRLRTDVVHIHRESCFDLTAALAVLTGRNTGIVRTVHGNFRLHGQAHMRRSARVRLARRIGTLWVSISQEVLETERSYVPWGDGTCVENWVDTDEIQSEANPATRREIRDALGIAASAKVLTLIGNCSEQKNHSLVTTALRGVSTPWVVLHVGSEQHATATEARGWTDLPDRHSVYRLGERSDVARLLAASDVVAIPSLVEGFSLVAVESLCAGVPVLANDVAGLKWLREFAAVRPVSPDLSAWTYALEGHDSAGMFRAANRDATQIQSRFSPARGVSQYVAIYRNATSGKGKF
jgi:glycosyltransferase involved in cell wall biosynthesis